MQDSSGNALDALPAISGPTSTAAASPPTSTPNIEDATVAVATSNAPQTQQLVTMVPMAMVNPAVVSGAPSAMPPPNLQPVATTPTGALQPTQQASAQDPISGYLLQDPSFVAAVRRQDATQAAQAAARVIKLNLHAIMSRIKPQQNVAMASFMASGAPQPHSHPQPGPGAYGAAAAAGPGGGYPPGGVPPGPSGERRLSDPDGRYKRGSSCEPMDLTGGGSGRVRELRRGDWVIIRSANKSTDPELLGQDAWVARVEHNGWVELQVPKLGRTVKLQQRYLQLIPPQHPLMLGPPAGAPPQSLGPPTTMPSPSAAAAAPPQPLGLPPPGRRATSDAGGMGPPGMSYADEQGRPYKRPQLDPSIRPALVLDAIPPARVAGTPGRGSTARVKELVRSVRRELLALEEAVPWNCVTPTWKNARPGWRRSLQRNVEASPAPAAVPAAATPTAAAAGPAPSAADAAASAAAAALVGATAASMLELHDALVTEKGAGLFASRGAWETRLRELADGGSNPACLQVLWAEMSEGIKLWLAVGSAPPGTPGGGCGAAAAGPGVPSYKSYDGMAADRGGDAYGGQALGEDDYYMAAAAAHQQHQILQQQQHHIPSPFFDYGVVSGGGGGAGRGGGAAGAMAGRPPVTPWVIRSDLTVLMQSLEAEVDTDLDEGPDATDLECGDDSDAEPPAAVRRRRRRQELLLQQQQQQQQQQQLRREQQHEQQPAPPADTEMREAAAVGEEQVGTQEDTATEKAAAVAAAAAAATASSPMEATAAAGADDGAEDGKPVEAALPDAATSAATRVDSAGTATEAAQPIAMDLAEAAPSPAPPAQGLDA